MKKAILQLFTTHIGRMLLAVVLTVIGGLIKQHTDDNYYIGLALMIIGLGTLIVYFVIMMAFGIKGTIEDNKGGNNG